MWDQSKVDIPKDHRVTILNGLILVMIIGSFIYSIVSYSSLPDRIPIHFNARGEADNWGHPGFIFIIQIISLPGCLIVYALSRMPSLHNYSTIKVTKENAPKLYALSRLFLTVINFQVVLLITYSSWEMIQVSKGSGNFGGWIFKFLIGSILVTVCVFYVKIHKFKKQNNLTDE